MRFESSVNDEYITRYVSRIPASDPIFGVIDQTGTLIAAAHVAVVGNTADLGLSVEAAHRRRGLGTRLLGATVTFAAESGLKRFSSQCLSHNRWMTTRMRRMGFSIDVDHETTVATLAIENVEQSFRSFTEQRDDALQRLETASYGAKVFFQPPVGETR